MASTDAEKKELIREYITLKECHQKLYFNYQELLKENEHMKNEIIVLKTERPNEESKSDERTLARENERLLAKVVQMRQSNQFKNETKMSATPQKSLPTSKVAIKSPTKTPRSQKQRKNNEYEVEKLLNHKGRKPNREFLVRWKNFPPENDTWEAEQNLCCPKMLKEYLKKKRLA